MGNRAWLLQTSPNCNGVCCVAGVVCSISITLLGDRLFMHRADVRRADLEKGTTSCKSPLPVHVPPDSMCIDLLQSAVAREQTQRLHALSLPQQCCFTGLTTTKGLVGHVNDKTVLGLED
jgi:hypothetical protein